MISGLLLFFVIAISHQTLSQNTDHLPPCTLELQGRHFPSGFDW
jgi:hypothetical protein